MWGTYRSLINKGYRKSLDIISEYIDFRIIKIKSGKRLFDWKVPMEWEITDAYIKDKYGKRKNENRVQSYWRPPMQGGRRRGLLTILVLREQLRKMVNDVISGARGSKVIKKLPRFTSAMSGSRQRIGALTSRITSSLPGFRKGDVCDPDPWKKSTCN